MHSYDQLRTLYNNLRVRMRRGTARTLRRRYNPRAIVDNSLGHTQPPEGLPPAPTHGEIAASPSRC
eukprot:8663745-Pyramimonas_sp.AAC.1